eukprot:SAG22_NODE_237_length_14221_cov_37.207832_15_plen_96_part_00
MTSAGSRPCAGFNTSCGGRTPCEVGCGASWLPPKIAPTPENPAKVVQVTAAAQSREWDVQFTRYSGGIGGGIGRLAQRQQIQSSHTSQANPLSCR